MQYISQLDWKKKSTQSTSKSRVWVANASATTGRAMFGALLTTGWICCAQSLGIITTQIVWTGLVVAITLALLSSLILLPAFYTKFLKEDAKKYLEEEE